MLRPAYLRRLGAKAYKLSKIKGWSSKYPRFSAYKTNGIRPDSKMSYYYSAANFFASLLESRLDVIAYRLFFLPTIFTARRFVRNGMFTVNGRIVKNPAYLVRNFNIISVRDDLILYFRRHIIEHFVNIFNLSVTSRDTLPVFLVDKYTKLLVKDGPLKRKNKVKATFFRRNNFEKRNTKTSSPSTAMAYAFILKRKLYTLKHYLQKFAFKYTLRDRVVALKRKKAFLRYLSCLRRKVDRVKKFYKFKDAKTFLSHTRFINRRSLASHPDYFSFSFALFYGFFLRELVTVDRVPFPFHCDLPYIANHYYKVFDRFMI